MSIHLDHHIVWARDKHASAKFLADILGVTATEPGEYFASVKLGNDVALDYVDSEDPQPGHYAFLVSEEEFDSIFARVIEAGVTYYATPPKVDTGNIYFHNGGRGFSFDDPNGHSMEVMTASYANEDYSTWRIGPYEPAGRPMTSRPGADRPEDLSRLFFERFNAGDLDGLVALFEPEAVSAHPDGGKASGVQEIRESFTELLASDLKFTPVQDRPALRNGDLAITTRRLPNGEVPVEVARRQADGTWLWVIDQPNILGH